MKNKILMFGLLTLVFAVSVTAYAVGQNTGSGTSNQVQTANQGEDTQIQVKTTEQTQQQAQQKLQDGSEASNQVKNQNQVQSQNASTTAVQRRSQVASAVQEMLQVADRNGGIGQQVRTIAQAQNQNQEKLEASLDKVQNRSSFAKFFVGPNYGEINNAEKLLEQNRARIQELNQIKNQLLYSDQQVITEQIQLLEQANLQIQNQLNNAGKGFSLLGWMFRLLSN